MKAENRNAIIKILASMLLLSVAMAAKAFFTKNGIIESNSLWFTLMFFVPYLICGYDIFLRAAESLLRGKIFNVNVLMIVATLGAIAVGEYFSAVASVVLFSFWVLTEKIISQKVTGKTGGDKGESALKEKFAVKFSGIFTPAAVAVAVLLAVIPPLIILKNGANELVGEVWTVWIRRGLGVIAVACPYALATGTCFAFSVGFVGAKKIDTVFKGNHYIEALARIKTLLFAKSGIFTERVSDGGESNERLKADGRETVSELKALGINTVIITSDRESQVKLLCEKLGADGCFSELSEKEKIEKIKELDGSGKTAFVSKKGEDAPLLKTAEIGISMGKQSAAKKGADIIINSDKSKAIISAVSHAKRVNKIAVLNLIFSLTAKALIILLIALGYVEVWVAVLADICTAAAVTLNALRAAKPKK